MAVPLDSNLHCYDKCLYMRPICAISKCICCRSSSIQSVVSLAHFPSGTACHPPPRKLKHLHFCQNKEMKDCNLKTCSTVLFCNGQLTPSFRETEKLGDFSSAALTFCICREVVDLDAMHSGRLSMCSSSS